MAMPLVRSVDARQTCATARAIVSVLFEDGADDLAQARRDAWGASA